jgi:hypothetical protein
MILAAVNTLLLADAAVTALVGEGKAARIYPRVLPQPCTFPAISFFRVSQVTVGDSHDGRGIDRARLEINSWAKSRAESAAVAAAVYDLLCPRRGADAGAGWQRRQVGNLELQRVVREDDRDLF